MSLSPELLKRLKSAPPREVDLQRSVANFLDHTGLLWCHVPNGGKRNAVVGAKLKAEGVKRGVPDVLIFDGFRTESATYSGLAIELKAGRNKPTPEQDRWNCRLTACKWRVEVCYSLDEALDVLRRCYPHRVK